MQHTEMAAELYQLVVFFLPALTSDDYFVAGRATAVSLVHGGPAPGCLSTSLFQAIVSGPEHVMVPLTEMPQSVAKTVLELVNTLVFGVNVQQM